MQRGTTLTNNRPLGRVILVGGGGAAILLGVLYYYFYVMTWDDKPIRNFGSYKLKDDYSLVVSRDSKDFIYFELKHKGITIVSPEDKASIFHKFVFFWDSQTKSLWFDSSDIGLMAYIPISKYSYKTHYVTPRLYTDYDRPQILNKDVPHNVRARLSRFDDEF